MQQRPVNTNFVVKETFETVNFLQKELIMTNAYIKQLEEEISRLKKDDGNMKETTSSNEV